LHHFYKYHKLIPILLFFYNLRQYQSFKNLGSQQGKGLIQVLPRPIMIKDGIRQEEYERTYK